MFRRRTSSTGKIHYRVNINKNVNLMPMGKVLVVTIE